jgi:methanogenic corrinoid protein MtbC1
MTISLDASIVSNEGALARNSGANMGADSCGDDADWGRGLRGLSRVQGRSPEISSSLLTKVIEGEIIPRLLLAHRAAPATPQKTEDLDELARSDAFARMLLARETSEITAQVERLLDLGIPPARIFLDLLAPIARRLGEFWLEDRWTFAEVTLGLSRLHQLLHEVGRRGGNSPLRGARRRAYFAPMPGEQHTFGLSMLEEFFLHAGWETAMGAEASLPVILDAVSKQRLDVVGLSVGCKERLDPLNALIHKVRAASLNRDVAVMVGGRVFLENPGLAAQFGPAAILPDAVHAVQTAESLVAARDSGKAIAATP